MALFDGALLKMAFNLAKNYIKNHPELVEKIMDMLEDWIFPSPTPVFGAGEEVPEVLQGFGAELEALKANGS